MLLYTTTLNDGAGLQGDTERPRQANITCCICGECEMKMRRAIAAGRAVPCAAIAQRD